MVVINGNQNTLEDVIRRLTNNLHQDGVDSKEHLFYVLPSALQVDKNRNLIVISEDAFVFAQEDSLFELTDGNTFPLFIRVSTVDGEIQKNLVTVSSKRLIEEAYAGTKKPVTKVSAMRNIPGHVVIGVSFDKFVESFVPKNVNLPHNMNRWTFQNL